jgi:ribosomal protein S18 acetylase RimI-like enzyme
MCRTSQIIRTADVASSRPRSPESGCAYRTPWSAGTVRGVSGVRIADVDDIDEIIRLRTVMLASMDGSAVPAGPWIDNTADTLRERLPDSDPTFVAFVIDQPDRLNPSGYMQSRRLACCVTGLIETRLGSPDHPSGRFGYVFNVCTDIDYRRRGYARACMEALLDWYAAHDVEKIDLKASADGHPLYLSLGFTPTSSSMLRYSASSARR